MTEDLGVRATYSTGFKAPTPGQSNTSNTSTELTGGVLVNNGTIPATSAVALRNGGAPLKAEDATNFTLGVYATIGEFDVTVDYFDIDVEDRLNLSSEVELTDDDIADLIAEGLIRTDRGSEYFGNDNTHTQKGDRKNFVEFEKVAASPEWGCRVEAGPLCSLFFVLT